MRTEIFWTKRPMEVFFMLGAIGCIYYYESEDNSRFDANPRKFLGKSFHFKQGISHEVSI